MKKTCLLISLAAIVLAGCTKTTNNTTVIPQPPAFLVNGVADIKIQNNAYYSQVQMSLTVQYSDSTQNTVSLSLSALPAGIAMDTTWTKSGIPTYSTTLTIYDTTAAGAVTGKYPITLTATTSTGSTKTYPFNLTVLAATPCTGPLLGKYTDCTSDCSLGGVYTDSVYSDPNVPNKIWFSNFANTGATIFGTYNCGNEQLIIPPQTVGGHTYSGNNFVGASSHFMNITYSNGTTSCEITME